MKKFTESHEWVLIERNTATVGISAHAQREIGKIVFIQFPRLGTFLQPYNDVACVLESTKAAIDIMSPVSGTVIEVHEALLNDLTPLNEAPEEEGWLFKLEISPPYELGHLMTEEEYAQMFALPLNGETTCPS